MGNDNEDQKPTEQPNQPQTPSEPVGGPATGDNGDEAAPGESQSE